MCSSLSIIGALIFTMVSFRSNSVYAVKIKPESQIDHDRRIDEQILGSLSVREESVLPNDLVDKALAIDYSLRNLNLDLLLIQPSDPNDNRTKTTHYD